MNKISIITNLPEWNNIGTEPTQEKKDNGFIVSEKPSSNLFNWLFNNNFKSLEELEEYLLNQERLLKSTNNIKPFFPNNLDLSKSSVAFIGDSHTAGQGATETGEEKTIGLPAPPGVTDLFHQRLDSSGIFCDKFARYMKSNYYMGMTNRVASANETTYYNTYSSNWIITQDVDANVLNNNWVAGTQLLGETIIKKMDPNFPNKRFRIHYVKFNQAGKIQIKFKSQSTGVSGLERDETTGYILPSQIGNVTRSDGVTGVDLDYIDMYDTNSSPEWNVYVDYFLPYNAIWEVEITTITKNPSSLGSYVSVQSHMIEINQFLNCGRGNHTTIDYLGNTVTKGAGGSGDFDHTDHLQEIINLGSITLAIIEPMIINDWFHGLSLKNTRNGLIEMFQRLKNENIDIIVMGPSPVITDKWLFDYEDNPDYVSKPPLSNNLNGQGTWDQYYQVLRDVCSATNTPMIDNLFYFLYRYYRSDHKNWTLGDDAGRIHVNQDGHDIYYESLIKFSGLVFYNQT